MTYRENISANTLFDQKPKVTLADQRIKSDIDLLPFTNLDCLPPHLFYLFTVSKNLE